MGLRLGLIGLKVGPKVPCWGAMSLGGVQCVSLVSGAIKD